MSLRSSDDGSPRSVAAAVAIGADVGGLQRRKRPLLRDDAAALVDVRHQHPEGALSQPRLDQMWLAIAGLRFVRN